MAGTMKIGIITIEGADTEKAMAEVGQALEDIRDRHEFDFDWEKTVEDVAPMFAHEHAVQSALHRTWGEND